VLAQRLRIVQAARLRSELIARHGEDSAFPRMPGVRREHHLVSGPSSMSPSVIWDEIRPRTSIANRDLPSSAVWRSGVRARFSHSPGPGAVLLATG
jgi:hypothetical protein